MKRIIYIAIFSLLFLLASLLLFKFNLFEALPMALLGGCLGWAFSEFKRETRARYKKR